uniref:NADH-ubiquinone oxidoreductase chain 4L n=1 Tax=Cicadellidae gen. sp. 1 JCX-2018 TaxID=2306300 RepID=A0A346RNJ5_9HEMI|nr:NADH dehydrogenase subunit 4L [Cicadellidae gen. sp. 1 JCX-2018]
MLFFWLIYIYYISLFCLVMIRKHIFMCLLSLEFLVLSLMLIFSVSCVFFDYELYLVVFMMIFFVCESVLGLSILIYMIRFYGNDYLNSMFLW